VAPADPDAGHGLIAAAIRDGASVSAAVVGTQVVGLAIAGPTDDRGRRELLAVGVAPSYRQRGLGGALLEQCVTAGRPGDTEYAAEITIAERDPVEPFDRRLRADIARRLLERAGFAVSPADAELRHADAGAITAVRRAI
jgi:ribosomal protein S18 acetylase RimI-like enzyme